MHHELLEREYRTQLMDFLFEKQSKIKSEIISNSILHIEKYRHIAEKMEAVCNQLSEIQEAIGRTPFDVQSQTTK